MLEALLKPQVYATNVSNHGFQDTVALSCVQFVDNLIITCFVNTSFKLDKDGVPELHDFRVPVATSKTTNGILDRRYNTSPS